MINEYDNLPESVSVYYSNQGVLYGTLFIFFVELSCYVILKIFDSSESQNSFHFFGFATATAIPLLAYYFWGLWKNWSYALWSKNKIPYLNFDKKSINLLGEKILWSSITYVKIFETPGLRRAKTYLVCGLASDLQYLDLSVGHRDKLTKFNGFISFKYGLKKNSFLSIPILRDDWGNLTLSSEKIGRTAEMYWSAATGAGERVAIHDNLPSRSISDEPYDTSFDTKIGPVTKLCGWLILICWILAVVFVILIERQDGFYANSVWQGRFGFLGVIVVLLLNYIHFRILRSLRVFKRPTKIPALKIAKVLGGILPLTLGFSIPFMIIGFSIGIPFLLNSYYGTEFSAEYQIFEKQNVRANKGCRTSIYVKNDEFSVSTLRFCEPYQIFDQMNVGDMMHVDGTTSQYGVDIKNQTYVGPTSSTQSVIQP